MGIQPGDAHFYKSERMHDFSDGGGRQTNNALPSGVQNELFPILSRLDVAYGRVNLRKIYAAVRSAILDTYFGAHSIITAPPESPKVSVVLFSTGSDFDTRDAARDRIESYVVAGPLTQMRLFGNQIVGQQAILVYQHVEEPLPDVGEVFVLSVEAGTPAQQYVRLTDVRHEVRTFIDDRGEFQRRVLTLKIGAPLKQTFLANEVSRLSTDTNVTKLRTTIVADASRYYGIQPITEAASAGALSIRLASVYALLVPSTQRETAVSLAEINDKRPYLPSGESQTVTYSVQLTNSESATIYAPRSVRPGTLRLRLMGNTFATLVDNGLGSVTAIETSGGYTDRGGGTIDYETGRITFGFTGGAAWIARFEDYLPAAPAPAPAHTRQIPITLGTRGIVYAETLRPIPAPGTLVVDYRALGRWYRLRDHGLGLLQGDDPSVGTGSLDYTTGACLITLGALPDVDSAVLLAWGSPVHYAIRAGATADAGTTLELRFTLQDVPVLRTTLEIGYPVNGIVRYATDSAGVISGTGVTGTINYATGEVVLQFSTPPDRGALLDIDYIWRDGLDLYNSGTTAPIVDGQFTVPGVAPYHNAGTMIFTVPALPGEVSNHGLTGYITEAGQVRVRGSQFGRWRAVDQPVGTFDASTGVVTLTSGVHFYTFRWTVSGLTWNGQFQEQPINDVSGIRVERDASTFDPNARSEQVSPEVGLTLDLTTTVGDRIVPGSVLFLATGQTYVDRDGTLYTDIDPATGSGLVAGSIDYSTGRCTLTYWADNAAVNRTVRACLTQYGDWTAVEAFFRTAGSPLRPASLYVQVTAADGALLTGASDQNGVITGPLMRGQVEQTMGVVAVEFGELVGGEWESVEVMPGTLRYNSVVVSNLPLSPEILGLDPVRLPSDGRVPIFRPGDMVVVHHTAETVVASPEASATYSVGRTQVAVIEVLDAAGDPLASTEYTAHLAAGTVTLAADYTGEGAITLRDRIEHMTVLLDVQINGQIALSGPLPHSYPEGSYVSSALLHGDLLARATTVWDQNTWTGGWSDTLIGSDTSAAYDDLAHPVEVNAQGTVRERWRLNFTNSTTFQIIGERVGVIGTGTTGGDVAPVNGATGEPYFILRAAGFGAGWSAGNQLRFNTYGPSEPVWCARTILAGAALTGDAFGLEIRGDVV